MTEPTPLITTEQLAAQLGDPNLRLYDCTTYNEPVPPGSDVPYRAVPGDKTFEAGHIPGADFSTCKASSPTPLRSNSS